MFPDSVMSRFHFLDLSFFGPSYVKKRMILFLMWMISLAFWNEHRELFLGDLKAQAILTRAADRKNGQEAKALLKLATPKKQSPFSEINTITVPSLEDEDSEGL